MTATLGRSSAAAVPVALVRLRTTLLRLSLQRPHVLFLHDAPADVEFTWRRQDGSVRRRYKSEAEGLAEAVARTRPRVCLFGHHHTRLDAEIAGVRCIGLNKVAMTGSLVALDVPARGRGDAVTRS